MGLIRVVVGTSAADAAEPHLQVQAQVHGLDSWFDLGLGSTVPLQRARSGGVDARFHHCFVTLRRVTHREVREVSRG